MNTGKLFSELFTSKATLTIAIPKIPRIIKIEKPNEIFIKNY